MAQPKPTAEPGPNGLGQLLERFDKTGHCPVKAIKAATQTVPAVGRHQVEPEPVDNTFGWDWFDALPQVKAATTSPEENFCRLKPAPKAAKPKPVKKVKGGNQKILDAAEAEFAARGFFGGRMGAIAQAAECNKALIHYYYRDKLSLYRHILAEIVETIVHQLESSLSSKQKGPAPIESLIDACLSLDEKLAGRLTILQREVLEGGRELALTMDPEGPVCQRLAGLLKPLLGPDWRPESLIKTLAGLLTAARLIEPRQASKTDRAHLKTTIRCLLGQPA